MVHRREIGGEPAVFGNQGDLYLNAMTWWDHGTGSIWSQPLGEAIAGPLQGERLELLPSVLSRWDAWLADHADTLALDAPGGTGGFDLDDMVVVVDFRTDSAAYPFGELERVIVINDVVAGAPIAVVADPQAEGRWSVLSRRLDDRTVTLAAGDRGELRDVETGTVWDPVRGRAVEGPLAGQVLALLPGFTAFPWEYRNIWPDGRIWDGSAAVGAPPLDVPVNPFRSTLRD